MERSPKKRKAPGAADKTPIAAPATSQPSNLAVSKRNKRMKKKAKPQKKAAEPPSSKLVAKNIADEPVRTDGNGNSLLKSEGVISASANHNPKTFTDLNLSPSLQATISGMGITNLTALQRKIIPLLLGGFDVAVTSNSRGRILSYLASAAALLETRHFQHFRGIAVIVLTSTSKLALQVFSTASRLLSNSSRTVALAVDCQTKHKKPGKGVDLLVATPPKLFDYLDNTNSIYRRTGLLIIDNACLLISLGQEEWLTKILIMLPKAERQTAIFASRANGKVYALGKLSCKPDKRCIYISSDEDEAQKATASAEVVAAERQANPQKYVFIDADKRFLLLYSFLKKFQKKGNIIVSFSSPTVARFYHSLLVALELPAAIIREGQTDKQQMAIFAKFKCEKQGILITIFTGLIEYGLDILNVGWIIQYDPSEDLSKYVQDIGPINGQCIVFLLPEERSFVTILKDANIAVEEFLFLKEKLVNIQDQVEKLVCTSSQLQTEAKDGYRAFVESSLFFQSISGKTRRNLGKIAKAFGLITLPKLSPACKRGKMKKDRKFLGPAEQVIGKKRKFQSDDSAECGDINPST